MKVGFCVIFTTFAFTIRFQWREIVSVFSILDVDTAILSVKGTIASHASRADTVKSIATVFYTNEEIDWFLPHAEKMTGLVFRKNLVDGF